GRDTLRQVATAGDPTPGQAVVATRIAAVAHCSAEMAGHRAGGSHRSGVVAVDRAAVADRGRLQAVGHRGGAAGEAERAPGLCTRAERGRTDFAGLRVQVEHRLASDWILVVEPADNGGARVNVVYRSGAASLG